MSSFSLQIIASFKNLDVLWRSTFSVKRENVTSHIGKIDRTDEQETCSSKKSIYSRVHEVAIHYEWENGINFAVTNFREFAKKRSQFSKM